MGFLRFRYYLCIASTVFFLPSGLFLGNISVYAQQRNLLEAARQALDTLLGRRQSQKIGLSSGDGKSLGPRDLCPITSYPLTSFVLPTTKPRLTYVEPVSSSNPTFWFYVPYTAAAPERTSRRMEFVLLGSDEQIVYERRFLLPKTAGVVSISMPQTAPPLPVGQRYRWVASVICNPLNRAGDATVNGWIERVNLPTAISNRLTQTINVADKVVIYAEQQLWYETVSAIASPAQPMNQFESDLQTIRNAFLKEVGLPENTPFLGAAVPEPSAPSRVGR